MPTAFLRAALAGRKTAIDFGDDRIPSGILVANLRGVRLSFRTCGLTPVGFAFHPLLVRQRRSVSEHDRTQDWG